jgi:predicted GNAT superfamily acetyltransferase
MKNIIAKELSKDDIQENMLKNFIRYQEVRKSYRKINNEWKIIDNKYIEDWAENEKRNIINDIKNILENNEGYVFGIYKNKNLIGFSILLNKKFGSEKQYIQLDVMVISYKYRNKGYGKMLRIFLSRHKNLGIQTERYVQLHRRFFKIMI